MRKAGQFRRECLILVAGSNTMQETLVECKSRRDKLKAKRDMLFERYLKSPQDSRMALEIKKIDDEIAEYTDRLRQPRKTSSFKS
jgi:uncharacterized coiled-coil DUF342 family protein